VEDLLRACARAGQLRTLQRVLAAGGARGRAALRSLCALLQDPGYSAADAPGVPGGTAAAGGRPGDAGGAAAAGPAEAGGGGGGGGGARGAAGDDGSAAVPAQQGSGGALTEVERLRFVYRCQLQLRLSDDAGAPGTGTWAPVPCCHGGPCAKSTHATAQQMCEQARTDSPPCAGALAPSQAPLTEPQACLSAIGLQGAPS